MDSFAVKGVSRLVGEIKIVEEVTGSRPKMVILPTHYSQNLQRVARMWRRMQAYRSSMLAEQLFISTSEMFPKSLEAYMPLTLQSPTSAPVQEYRRFTEHLLRKISSDLAGKSTTEGKPA
jgi:chromosome partitioning protein